MEGENRVDTGEASDEVSLEGVNRLLSRVGAVVVGWDELVFDVVVF